MDRDLTVKLAGLEKSDLRALLAFLLPDLSRNGPETPSEVTNVNGGIDAGESSVKQPNPPEN
jgi:hypothetical protein